MSLGLRNDPPIHLRKPPLFKIPLVLRLELVSELLWGTKFAHEQELHECLIARLGVLGTQPKTSDDFCAVEIPSSRDQAATFLLMLSRATTAEAEREREEREAEKCPAIDRFHLCSH